MSVNKNQTINESKLQTQKMIRKMITKKMYITRYACTLSKHFDFHHFLKSFGSILAFVFCFFVYFTILEDIRESGIRVGDSISSFVTIWEKIYVEFIFALNENEIYFQDHRKSKEH